MGREFERDTDTSVSIGFCVSTYDWRGDAKVRIFKRGSTDTGVTLV